MATFIYANATMATDPSSLNYYRYNLYISKRRVGTSDSWTFISSSATTSLEEINTAIQGLSFDDRYVYRFDANLLAQTTSGESSHYYAADIMINDSYIIHNGTTISSVSSPLSFSKLKSLSIIYSAGYEYAQPVSYPCFSYIVIPATQVGFQLESSLASKHLTDSKYIQGAYIVVDTLEERDALPLSINGNDGVIVIGSLVYVGGSVNKSYRYTSSGWAEEVIDIDGAVLYTQQSLTRNQQIQATANINAISNYDVDDEDWIVPFTNGNITKNILLKKDNSYISPVQVGNILNIYTTVYDSSQSTNILALT